MRKCFLLLYFERYEYSVCVSACVPFVCLVPWRPEPGDGVRHPGTGAPDCNEVPHDSYRPNLYSGYVCIYTYVHIDINVCMYVCSVKNICYVFCL